MIIINSDLTRRIKKSKNKSEIFEVGILCSCRQYLCFCDFFLYMLFRVPDFIHRPHTHTQLHYELSFHQKSDSFLSYVRYLSQILVSHCWLYLTLKIWVILFSVCLGFWGCAGPSLLQGHFSSWEATLSVRGHLTVVASRVEHWL